MNREIVIKCEDITKIYPMYKSPKDMFKEALHPLRKKYHEDFYSLNGVSFEISKGECVGVIGKNGAGKSTLLKLITGVSSPTSGKVYTNGVISSLLELGAGFNPSLSGVENIFLNGLLMGLSRAEINSKLETVIEFADIGEHINHPVKNYSSGMYVRLAFSCAINVDPDILIIDEALSVGDAKFQMKCFRRLDEIKQSGATIIFVSHDISSIKSFCSRAILINGGKLIADGLPLDVAVEYNKLLFPQDKSFKVNNKKDKLIESSNIEKSNINSMQADLSDLSRVFGIGGVKIERISMQGISQNTIKGGDEVTVNIDYSCDINFLEQVRVQEGVVDNIIIGVSVSNIQGTYLFGMTSFDKELLISIVESGKRSIEFKFIFPYIMNGDYLLNTAIALGTQEAHTQLIWLEGFHKINVESSKKYVYGLFYNDYKVRML